MFKSYSDIKAKKEFERELAEIRKYGKQKAKNAKKKKFTQNPKLKLKNGSAVSYVAGSHTPSFAEKLIIDILNKHNYYFDREVSFAGFTNDRGNHYRYDFYLPELSLIIEYDGKQHKHYKNVDDLKNRYCIANNIHYARFNRKNWQTLEQDILNAIQRAKDVKLQMILQS